MRKPETALRTRIVSAIEDKYGADAFVFKIHGGPYQDAGMPDLLLCVRGRYIGLEVKMPGEIPTPIQFNRIGKIRKALGYAEYVESVREALFQIDLAIQPRCKYCFRRFGEKVFRKGKPIILRMESDHFVPKSYSKDDSFPNRISACQICNRLKAAKVFDTLEDARRFLAIRWHEMRIRDRELWERNR